MNINPVAVLLGVHSEAAFKHLVGAVLRRPCDAGHPVEGAARSADRRDGHPRAGGRWLTRALLRDLPVAGVAADMEIWIEQPEADDQVEDGPER